MDSQETLLIAFAAFAAGVMNAVAGGGTFFSFPALLAVGVPPILANASNSVALWPASLSSAWAFHHELSRFRHQLVILSLVALIGGLVGGLLLLITSNKVFSLLIPALLALATVAFAFSGQIGKRLYGPRSVTGSINGKFSLMLYFFVCVYGGFFGAGMGILLLAALAIQGIENLMEANALKNWLSAVVYSVAVFTFISAGAISWPHTLIMTITATLGGYCGTKLARRIPQHLLRCFIVAVGTSLTCYYFIKTF